LIVKLEQKGQSLLTDLKKKAKVINRLKEKAKFINRLKEKGQVYRKHWHIVN